MQVKEHDNFIKAIEIIENNVEVEKKAAEIEEVANWTHDAAREGALAYWYLEKATKLNQIGEYSVSDEADEFEAEVRLTLVETTTVKKFIVQCEEMKREGEKIPQGRRYFYSTKKT